MIFEELLDQAVAMLQRRGRMTYRALRLHFQLDEETLEALKEELLYSQPQVVDDEGRGTHVDRRNLQAHRQPPLSLRSQHYRLLSRNSTPLRSHSLPDCTSSSGGRTSPAHRAVL